MACVRAARLAAVAGSTVRAVVAHSSDGAASAVDGVGATAVDVAFITIDLAVMAVARDADTAIDRASTGITRTVAVFFATLSDGAPTAHSAAAVVVGLVSVLMSVEALIGDAQEVRSPSRLQLHASDAQS